MDTLEELVASDDFTWGIVNYGAADYQLFSTSEVRLFVGEKVFFNPNAKGGALQANLQWTGILSGPCGVHGKGF